MASRKNNKALVYIRVGGKVYRVVVSGMYSYEELYSSSKVIKKYNTDWYIYPYLWVHPKHKTVLVINGMDF